MLKTSLKEISFSESERVNLFIDFKSEGFSVPGDSREVLKGNFVKGVMGAVFA